MNDTAENKNQEIAAIPRLYIDYRDNMVSQLMDSLGVSNKLAIPRLDKIVLNMGVGAAKEDEKILNEAVEVLSIIAGQKPVITRARKSVAGFKLRAGMPIGCKVTLRRNRMYEFFDRLINIVFPRIRDFRGFSPKAFDGSGNYSLGLDEYVVFPEIDPDNYTNIFGLDVTICTTAKYDDDAKVLFDLLGFPFTK